MTHDTVKLEKRDGVGIITLNTPHNMNALSTKLGRDLSQVVEEVNKDNDVKVVILTGAGKGFCSGADLAEMVHAADVLLKGGTPRRPSSGRTSGRNRQVTS